MEKGGLRKQRWGGFMEMGSVDRQRKGAFPVSCPWHYLLHLSSVHHPPSSYRQSLSAYCVRHTAVRKTGFRQTATHVINNNQTQKFRWLCALPCRLGLCFSSLASSLLVCPLWPLLLWPFRTPSGPRFLTAAGQKVNSACL